jgi:very-short-patch-repair endonuclease
VECDGHDFHERTKEQAARDKKRDRDLLSRGVTTIRFTGPEIYKNAEGCARQLWKIIENQTSNIITQAGA